MGHTWCMTFSMVRITINMVCFTSSWYPESRHYHHGNDLWNYSYISIVWKWCANCLLTQEHNMSDNAAQAYMHFHSWKNNQQYQIHNLKDFSNTLEIFGCFIFIKINKISLIGRILVNIFSMKYDWNWSHNNHKVWSG